MTCDSRILLPAVFSLGLRIALSSCPVSRPWKVQALEVAAGGEVAKRSRLAAVGGGEWVMPGPRCWSIGAAARTGAVGQRRVPLWECAIRVPADCGGIRCAIRASTRRGVAGGRARQYGSVAPFGTATCSAESSDDPRSAHRSCLAGWREAASPVQDGAGADGACAGLLGSAGKPGLHRSIEKGRFPGVRARFSSTSAADAARVRPATRPRRLRRPRPAKRHVRRPVASASSRRRVRRASGRR